MPKTYIACSLIAFALYATAQLRGWSLLPTEAEEVMRMRAEQSESARGHRTGGGGFFSGHK